MRTWRPYWWMTAVAALAGLSAIVHAQQSPRELFERARLMAEKGGNPTRVVELYKQVLAEAKTDRSLAAAASLQIALLADRQGKPQAAALFAAIVRDYPDQQQVIATATARLAATRAGHGGRSDLVPRRVLDGGWASIVDIGANGRVAVGWQRAGYSARNIVVRDMETGKETVLITGGPTGSAGQARISPDGRRVAFNWQDVDEASKVTATSVRVASVDGGAPQEVLQLAPGTSMRPSGWSPDGKRLLVNIRHFERDFEGPVSSTEVAWLTLADKSVQVLKTFEDWRDHFPEQLSPDGRYIAYSATAARGSRDYYLYVLDAQTQRETPVVTSAGQPGAPVWSADGSHLLYVDASVLKSIELVNGQPVGEPRVEQSNFTGRPIAVNTAGVFFYEQAAGGGNYEFITPRAPSASDRPVVFPGLSGAWSRDGRSIAFVRGGGGTTLDVVVRDVVSGEERSYHHEGIGVQSPRWMPDGRGLLAIVNEIVDGTQQPAFYRVDLASGSFQRLFSLRTQDYVRSGVAALSPDGKTLYAGMSSKDDAPVTGVVAISLATGEDRPVVSFPAVERGNDFGIAVSPDGGTLAVAVRVKAFATARIFTVGVDGSNRRDVFGPFATGWLWDQLRWTPDGRGLVFTAFDANRNWRIMRVPAEGGTPEFDGVSYDVISSLLPSFRLWQGNFNNIDLSPDGTHIITSALTSSKYEIWTLDGLTAAVNAR